MSYLILYFSGTGNTELIAKEIANRLEGKNKSVELVSIENKEQVKNLDLGKKIIGFAYPIYKFTYPDIFQHTLELVNQKAKNNKYFQFSTYTRFQSNSFTDFSKKLNPDKFHLIAEKAFKAPSCGIASKKDPDDYEYKSVMFFEDDIHIKLDAFVSDILAASSIKKKARRISPFDKLKKGIVKDIEITKYPYLSINKDLCTSCGLCAKNCPEQNLIQDSQSKKIHIVDHVNCLHCLRCMHHCPVNAINFGSLTEGNNQYTFKIRDQLFSKSINGFHEPYWKIFKKVIRKWRRNTILYWLNQKLKY